MSISGVVAEFLPFSNFGGEAPSFCGIGALVHPLCREGVDNAGSAGRWWVGVLAETFFRCHSYSLLFLIQMVGFSASWSLVVSVSTTPGGGFMFISLSRPDGVCRSGRGDISALSLT